MEPKGRGVGKKLLPLPFSPMFSKSLYLKSKRKAIGISGIY